jgi:hypothetical protein
MVLRRLGQTLARVSETVPWSVSLSSDAPYWWPPSRKAEDGLSVGVVVSKAVSGPFPVGGEVAKWRRLSTEAPAQDVRHRERDLDQRDAMNYS